MPRFGGLYTLALPKPRFILLATSFLSAPIVTFAVTTTAECNQVVHHIAA